MRRRNTRMLTLRLDLEEDADIIAWLDSLPEGQRSQTIRDTLRLQMEERRGQQQSNVDLEGIRAIVADEINRALTGRQIIDYESGQPSEHLDPERRYGEKLDQMLGSLQSRNRSGED